MLCNNLDHRVYLSDARTMAQLHVESIDLVYTAPPFWNHLKYSDDKAQLGNVNDIATFYTELLQVFRESVRVLKTGHLLVLQCFDFYQTKTGEIAELIPFHARMLTDLPRLGLVPVDHSIWLTHEAKNNPTLPQDGNALRQRQDLLQQRLTHVLVFVKGQVTAATPALTQNYWQPVKRSTEHSRLLHSHQLYRVSRWLLSLLPQKTIDRIKRIGNQKQVVQHTARQYEAESAAAPCEDAILRYSKPDETVLDPFVGSGVTIACAEALQRNTISFEINPKMSAIIQDRLQDTQIVFLT